MNNDEKNQFYKKYNNDVSTLLESTCKITNKDKYTDNQMYFNSLIKDEQNEKEKQEIFENISNNIDKYYSPRQCRYVEVPENIDSIQKGQYCSLAVAGGGFFTQWYYYCTLDGRHMLIFEFLKNDTKIYSGREIKKRPSYLDNGTFIELEINYEVLN